MVNIFRKEKNFLELLSLTFEKNAHLDCSLTCNTCTLSEAGAPYFSLALVWSLHAHCCTGFCLKTRLINGEFQISSTYQVWAPQNFRIRSSCRRGNWALPWEHFYRECHLFARLNFEKNLWSSLCSKYRH